MLGFDDGGMLGFDDGGMLGRVLVSLRAVLLGITRGGGGMPGIPGRGGGMTSIQKKFKNFQNLELSPNLSAIR